MPIATIPLAGTYKNRNTDPVNSVTKDRFLINAYPEVDVDIIANTKAAYVNRRPGVLAAVALSGVSVGAQGACYWSGKNIGAISYVNNPATTTSVWNTALTKIGGDIANTQNCLALTEASVSDTANLVGYFMDSGNSAVEAWYYPDGGAWTQITDSDFPPNLGSPDALVGAPIQIDGFELVLTATGKLYNSGINTLSAWAGDNYIQATMYPDPGRDLAKYKNTAVVFGSRSIEFFRNAGNPVGSPFSRVAELAINMGVPVPLSTNRRKVCEVDGTVYFIGVSPDSGKVGIYRLNGYAPEKVSSPAIDKLCSTTSTTDGISGIVGAFVAHGQSHIMFSTYESDAGNGASPYCYCTDSGYWWRYVDANSRIIAGIATINGANYFAADSTQTLYNGTTTVDYRDNSTAYTATIQTEPNVLNNGRAFQINYIELIADNQSSGNTGIAVCGDDYATFTTARNFDMTKTRKRLWRFGYFKNHAIFKLTHSDNTAWRGQVLLVDWEPCTT